MDFNFEIDEHVQKERLDKIEKLSKDPLVVAFLKKNNLDRSFLEKNSTYFQDYIANVSKCMGCQGIEFCRQPIPGKVKNLYVDEFGFLEERYQSCRNFKALEQAICHKDNFRLSHLSNADYQVDLNKIDLMNESQQYVVAYTEVLKSLTRDKGIYLYGQPGVGKSYLMNGVCNYYAKNGKRVSFVRVPLLIQDLKQSMFDQEYRQDVLAHLRFSEVLVMDDIGSESITAWTRDEILFPVLDYRMNHNLKTYFTSNYTIDELENQYCLKDKNGYVASIRLMERIKTLSDVVALKGGSRR